MSGCSSRTVPTSAMSSAGRAPAERAVSGSHLFTAVTGLGELGLGGHPRIPCPQLQQLHVALPQHQRGPVELLPSVAAPPVRCWCGTAQVGVGDLDRL